MRPSRIRHGVYARCTAKNGKVRLNYGQWRASTLLGRWQTLSMDGGFTLSQLHTRLLGRWQTLSMDGGGFTLSHPSPWTVAWYCGFTLPWLDTLGLMYLLKYQNYVSIAFSTLKVAVLVSSSFVRLMSVLRSRFNCIRVSGESTSSWNTKSPLTAAPYTR